MRLRRLVGRVAFTCVRPSRLDGGGVCPSELWPGGKVVAHAFAVQRWGGYKHA